MAEEKKFPSVSEAEKQGKGVGALADRPNLAATYGKGGLTAAELKNWFDGLASLIIEKYNGLGDDMQSGDATAYIGVPEDAAFPEGTASTLKDVLTGIVSGALAQYLVAYAKEGADGGAGTKVSLQSFVLDALKRIGTAESDIDALESRATSLEGSVGDDTTEGTVKGRVKSLEGRMHTAEGDIDSLEIKMTTADGDIDNLEKRASRVEDRATALESRADGFDSSFVSTDGRLTSLEGRASTAESNISYIKGKLASFGLLKDVVFDEKTDIVTFTFVVGDTTKQIPISLADFIDSAELSAQITEQVTALAGEYVNQAQESASQAQHSEGIARGLADKSEHYSELSEASAQKAANSASEADAAKETANSAANSSSSSAEDASYYASQAKASADKAEMYSQTSEDRWSVFDKRLTNVENGISADPFVTDDTIAYQKTVPANALPFAALERVGGMSYKSNNLWKSTDGGVTSSGVAITCEKGVYTLNGECHSSVNYLVANIKLEEGTYTLAANNPKNNGNTVALCQVYSETTGKFITANDNVNNSVGTNTLTTGTYELRIRLAGGVTYTNFVVKPMLVNGSADLPFMPYFEGIRHAATTSVESKGRNLFNPVRFAPFSNYGITIKQVDDYIEIDGTLNYPDAGSLTYRATVEEIALDQNATYTLKCFFESGSVTVPSGKNCVFYVDRLDYKGTSSNWLAVPISKTESKTNTNGAYESTQRAWFYIGNGTVFQKARFRLLFAKSNEAVEYSRYFKLTMPIPEAWQSLPYYGYGINADVNNHIEFETEYVQMCSERAYQSGDENNPEVVTDGTRTVYALSTPVRTPITFTDNYIRVGGSGTITFVNEHKMAVPSTVLYLTKEASV